MQVNINDVFQFPNGKYQYKVIDMYGDGDFVVVKVYYSGVYLRTKCLYAVNPFFKEQNMIYNDKTGQWKLK